MRIHRLVLSTSFPEGPGDSSGHFVHQEVVEARARGEHVSVVAAGGIHRELSVNQTESEDAPTFLGGRQLFQAPGALSRLRRSPHLGLLLPMLAFRFLRIAARTPRCDAIDAHWLIPFGWPGLLFLSGEATVVLHGTDVRLFAKFPRPLQHLALRQLRGRGVRLRFVSEALKKDLLHIGKWPADLSAYIRGGCVRPAPIAVPALTRADARQQLGLEQEERLVVLCGRLIEGKRTATALSAASLIPGARLVVIGDGPERASLMTAFPHAHFLGALPRDRGLSWLCAADLVLHASLLEGAPTVIREARLLGTPVVCCPSGDVVTWATGDPELWCCG